jgi:hypothetical protein
MDRMLDISFLSENDKKSFWFCGIYNNDETGRQLYNNLAIGILTTAFNFYIWTCKLRKTNVSYSSLVLELDSVMQSTVALSRKVRLHCNSLNFAYFRKWHRGQDGGGENGAREEDGAA